MNANGARRNVLLVASKQPSDVTHELGYLGEENGVPVYWCTDYQKFLDDPKHRKLVAMDIVQQTKNLWMKGDEPDVYVLVHKSDDSFIHAQMGLADELLKVLGSRIYPVIPNEDSDEIRNGIQRCMDTKRQTMPHREQLRSPLLWTFDNEDLVDLRKVLAEVRKSAVGQGR